ncbi:hypothetical protein [Acetobacter sp.]|uniref:hypothetical protein n=1 Tax=Acetobacter sp. TaxID=440 RepID=UPI0025BCB5D1|nr:hypothetical protein [Acetobacter sp.]MCH4090084.1 hypothetical protein [Acetobacter sp.]MCI1298780.1 hypothetical protein [Acetobacter sp.]MCI1314799.1 hypothetical protein [Acetobacter sp.]
MTPDSPDYMDPKAVPHLHGVDGIRLAMAMTDTHQLSVGEGDEAVTVQLPPQARGIFPLIDGRNTVADLATRLETRGVNASQFESVWRATVAALAPFGLLSVAPPAP